MSDVSTRERKFLGRLNNVWVPAASIGVTMWVEKNWGETASYAFLGGFCFCVITALFAAFFEALADYRASEDRPR